MPAAIDSSAQRLELGAPGRPKIGTDARQERTGKAKHAGRVRSQAAEAVRGRDSRADAPVRAVHAIRELTQNPVTDHLGRSADTPGSPSTCSPVGAPMTDMTRSPPQASS